MKLTTFDFNDAPVRALLDGLGEPWFVATDVCRVLDLSNPTESLRGIDDDDLSNSEVIDSLGRTQTANTVSEAGLYQLVFASRKPEAKAFKRWVTKEVLPAIRKTGRYGPAALTAPEEKQVQGMLAVVSQALTDRAAGKLSNGDACSIANLAAQYCRLWDVALRIRGGRSVEALPVA